MATAPEKPFSPIRETNTEAIRLAKTLMRTARFGALAVLQPDTGFPFASRVALATAADGAPVILVSKLSGHTKGLQADPRCSILVGEPGKGDPLAHPRMTIQCTAAFLVPGNNDREAVAERYLRRNPKARLYAGFGDFSYMRLEPEWASLNGGFGQAFRLTRDNLLDDENASSKIAAVETSAIEHMQNDHPQSLHSILETHGESKPAAWRLTGIDSSGLDFTSGEKITRIWFKMTPADASQLPGAISSLYKE